MYVCLFCIVAFIIAFSVEEEELLIGMILVGVILLITIFISLGVIWSQHDFHLPIIYIRMSNLIYFSLFFTSIALAIYIGLYWLWIFAIICVYFILYLIVLAIIHLRTTRTKQVTTSRYIFPVHHTPTLASPDINIDNIGLISIYLISFILLLWELWPLYYFLHLGLVGGVFAIGLFIFTIITFDSLYSPPIRFYSAWNIIESQTELIEEVREAAVTSQLRKEIRGRMRVWNGK